eukprot:COSAG01_NODE_34828_length_541_cov_1.235294_1_plen_97_part_00
MRHFGLIDGGVRSVSCGLSHVQSAVSACDAGAIMPRSTRGLTVCTLCDTSADHDHDVFLDSSPHHDVFLDRHSSGIRRELTHHHACIEDTCGPSAT